jgi:bifunctional non-homologous end joining protein LigD
MKPMLCEKATIEEVEQLSPGDWIAQRKHDGLRAYIDNGKLYNRHGKDITKQFPEFAGIKDLHGFDGEIVAISEDFTDISGRAHLKDAFSIKILSQKHPARFMCFDVWDSDKPFKDRHAEILDKMMNSKPLWFHLVGWHEIEHAWAQANRDNWEGIVVKRIDAPYQQGVRSKDQLKVKRFVEENAVFTTYQEHARGIRIATADGKSININGAQAAPIKAIIDREGQITCGVQYLPQASGVWRIPSFRGICTTKGDANDG